MRTHTGGIGRVAIVAAVFALMSFGPAAALAKDEPLLPGESPPKMKAHDFPKPSTEPQPQPSAAPTDIAQYDDGSLVAAGGSDDGGISAMSLTRYYISTSSGYVTLRDLPGSLTVALGKNGWGFDQVDGRIVNGWVYGYTAADVQKCTWMQDGSRGSKTPGQYFQGDCTNVASLRRQDYMQGWPGNNFAPGGNCGYREDGTPYCDGQPTYIDGYRCPAGAGVYANVQPWNGGYQVNPAAYLYVLPPWTLVRWRYISLNFGWVMMRDTRTSGRPIAQDWGFVPSYCITQYPGLRSPYVE